MEIAIEAFFDEESNKAIRSIWMDLADKNLAPFLHESGAHPHITLAVLKNADLNKLEDAVQKFKKEVQVKTVSFYGIGIFSAPKPVVFAAPFVSKELLQSHRSLHDRLTSSCGQCWNHYLPNQWVPHCTLGFDFNPEKLDQVVACCATHGLRFSATITELGIVEVSSAKTLKHIPLL